jgi:hypothetical protein
MPDSDRITVTSDETGELVDVLPVHAVAALASTSTLTKSELPPDASKVIQDAMVAAATNAIAEHGHDPDVVREAMLKARESVKLAMRNQMRELWSQHEAAQQEK